MGAPKGNNFWKLRKDMKDGGRKLTVDEILKGTEEYIDRCTSEPILELDFKGKDNEEVNYQRPRAMTIFGVCFHLGITHETWREWRKDEKYSVVLLKIETLFKAYNVEYAVAGLMKENIISRIEGIRETVNSEVKEVSKFSDKSDEEIEDELNNLEQRG